MKWYIIEAWKDNFTFGRIKIEEIKGDMGIVETRESWTNAYGMLHFRARLFANNMSTALSRFCTDLGEII